MKNLRTTALKNFVYILLISITTLLSCNSPLFSGKLSEGIIEYDITYTHPEELTMGVDMMPKLMKYHFSEGYTSSQISAGMGLLQSDVISNHEQQSLTQTLLILGKKYKVVYGKKDIDSIVSKEPKMKLIHGNETKKIAGYKCKKVRCDYEDPTLADVDIYYTTDIKISEPNWFSVYSGIEGVLMEFYLYRYNIHMKLTAKTVIKESLEPSVFEVDSDYKAISTKEMDSYFKM